MQYYYTNEMADARIQNAGRVNTKEHCVPPRRYEDATLSLRLHLHHSKYLLHVQEHFKQMTTYCTLLFQIMIGMLNAVVRDLR